MNKFIKFYYSDDKKKLQINYTLLIDFLIDKGIYLYYPDEENYIFVRKLENVVHEISRSEIMKLCLDHVKNSDWEFKDAIQEKMRRSLNNLFSKNHLETLNKLEDNFLLDEKESAYLPFKNGIVVVTKKSIKIIKHDKLDRLLWSNRIFERDYKPEPNNDEEKEPGIFEDFIYKISNNDKQRIAATESIIGYLLHGFKNPGLPKAVVLYGEKDLLHSNRAEGRIGKGIIVTAIQQFRKTNIEAGKQLNFRNSFVFQQIEISTEIIVLDDIPKNFVFENLFSAISEGIQIEKKFQPKFYIPYSKSPKIVISSNYPLSGIGASHEGRKIELAIYPYFNANNTPEKFYGQLFFSEWSLEEWERFDHYMISCLQQYLNNGLMEYQDPNIKYGKLALATDDVFAKFCKDFNFSTDWFHIKTLYDSFAEYCESNGYTADHSTQNMFTRNLKVYAEFFELDISSKKSNGITLFKFTKG